MPPPNGTSSVSPVGQSTEDRDHGSATWALPATDEIKGNFNGVTVHQELTEISESVDNEQLVQTKLDLGCKEKLNKTNCPEKTVFMTSIATLVVVCCSMMSFKWVLPYLYTAYLCILLPIRAYKYTQMKWQFFLADWCYVANIIILLFLWAAPHKSNFFMVVFGITNGPVMWSVVLFRNCLGPHSIERMTCLVIHLMPSLVMYLVRWYPVETSLHWYRDFTNTRIEEVATGWEFLWIFAVPFACYICHLVLYLVIFLWVLGSCYDSLEYYNNYTYIAYYGERGFSKAIRCNGGRFRMLVYMIFQVIYSVISGLTTWIWYNFWIAHVVFLCFVFTVVTYNGSTYYLDLFPKKGYDSDPYRLCETAPEFKPSATT